MLKRKYVYLIIIVLIIISCAYSASICDWTAYTISSVDRNLPDESIEIYNTRLVEAENIFEVARQEGDIEKEYGALHTIAAQYYGLGNLRKAFKYYRTASMLIPDNHTAYKEMSKVMSEDGNYEKALEYINRAIDLKSDSTSSWIMKLTLIQDNSDNSYDDVLVVYNDAIAATNNNLNILTIYARFLEKYENYEFALKTWQQLAGMVVENELFLEEVDRLEEILNK